MADRLTILLSGMIAADPEQGGATWAVLQYLLGLRRLGHEVVFVESIPDRSLAPKKVPLDRTRNADYFRRVMRDFGFDTTSAILVAGTRQTLGLSYDQIRRVAHSADLLINISGMLKDEELIGNIPCRVYLDVDPAFNQLWHMVHGCDMRFRGHTHFVTIGLAIGQSACSVPTCGLPWITTLQPVVLSCWPVAQQITHYAMTTVGHWRSYGSIEHGGMFYGQKAHSLRQFFTLPTLTTERFMLALAIHPDERIDLAALAANGWELLDACASGRHSRRLSAVHPGLQGGVRCRQEWLRDLALRLVQRSQSLLPRFGPAGAGARNRLRSLYTGGRGIIRIQIDGGYSGRHRRNTSELHPTRAGGAGHRRRVI